jgi:hypothetical protein
MGKVGSAFFLFALTMLAQTQPSSQIGALLPSDAMVIETADLHLSSGKQRTLVLWMRNPKKEVRNPDRGFCSDAVYGDARVGPASLSLVDIAARKLLNTVQITGPSDSRDSDDSFPLPFLVGGDYYHVPSFTSQNEGKPQIMFFEDLTGDGIRAEFVLFSYSACGIISTSVFGYDTKSDRAVQYPTEVVRREGGRTIERWMDQVFRTKPNSPGHWDLSWEPGHGADVMIHDKVSFDKARQRFVDHQSITTIPEGRLDVPQSRNRRGNALPR